MSNSDKKTVYALFRQGSYRHECGGIFSSREKAQAAKTELEGQEPDDYHLWDCIPFELDKTTETNRSPNWYDFEVLEPKAIDCTETDISDKSVTPGQNK